MSELGSLRKQELRPTPDGKRTVHFKPVVHVRQGTDAASAGLGALLEERLAAAAFDVARARPGAAVVDEAPKKHEGGSGREGGGEGGDVEGQPCDVVVHIGAGLRLGAAGGATDGDASGYALSRLVPGGLLFVELALALAGAEDDGGEGRSAALASHFPVDAWALPDAKWQPLPGAADAGAGAGAEEEGEGSSSTRFARFLVVLRRP